MTNSASATYEDAEAVERHACPRCDVPAGSPCRTNNETVAPTYHTARHVLVPSLRKGLGVKTPRDRRPGKPWTPGPELAAPAPAPARGLGDTLRIGYARCSTRGQELGSQLDALNPVCNKVFSEKVSTRQKTLAKQELAMVYAADLHQTTGQTVIFAVTELDRLGRDAAELIAAADRIEHSGLMLEFLDGPLKGVYDPSGPGRALFLLFAGISESVREGIREKTLEGLDMAVRKGKFGGRPSVVTEDMLAIALHRRDAKSESVTEIARTLLQTEGKNKGKPVGRSALYQALKSHDDAMREAAPEP
ncbi:recombinase family protein [Streptomyces sp. MAA16]|uniref:recombinase family protein n=1 Tax=Streptomyces sp. MAA16 TaxID=3035116 RepID=UPI0024770B17|nr:recombinase family protein [Streptomyces sp. MAA16]MDH6700453.1 DNA invertase Pin-like site-specific DNA recombinase [Streptomyces sp. MAA16]